MIFLFYMLVKCTTAGVNNQSQGHRVNLLFSYDSDSSEDTQISILGSDPHLQKLSHSLVLTDLQP